MCQRYAWALEDRRCSASQLTLVLHVMVIEVQKIHTTALVVMESMELQKTL
jgi:hypothetical protein